MLSINQIISPVSGKESILKSMSRFLGLDENGDALLIIINDKYRSKPFRVQFTNLLEQLKYGDLMIVKKFETGVPLSETKLRGKAKKQFRKNINLMQPIIDNEVLLFNETERDKVFKESSERFGVSVKTIQRHYYRYLGSGMNILSLAPQFGRRGGPGKKRKGYGRRGIESEEATTETPEIREKIENGIREFLLTEKHTVKEAYIKTLKKYFKNEINLIDSTGKILPLQEILSKYPHLPNERRFSYLSVFVEKEKGKRKKFPRHSRPLSDPKTFLGNAREYVPGPGYKFEIDATKIQIRLVSIFDRSNIIGDPIAYNIIDVWSGAITGYAISLESNGWSIAREALMCCFQEKDKIFRRLNLPYTNIDWPCHHLPYILSADRAEIIGEKPEILVTLGGMTIEIMPPMRPDLKPFVERSFNEIKHGDFYNLPGRHVKYLKRRESTGNDTAALTLPEFERIHVHKIIHFNNEPATFGQIPSDILQYIEPEMTRIGLLKWGMEHRAGFTRTLPDKAVFSFLLTEATASVTIKGIRFRHQFYMSKILIKHGYLSCAKKGHTYKIQIFYTENRTDVIWFFDEKIGDLVHAENTNEDIRRLKVSFYELDSFRKILEKRIEVAKIYNIERKIEDGKSIKKICSNAKAQAKIAKSGQNKGEKIGNINENRKIEKFAEREIKSAEDVASYSYGIENVREKERQSIKTKKRIQHKKPNNKSLTDISLEIWEKNNENSD